MHARAPSRGHPHICICICLNAGVHSLKCMHACRNATIAPCLPACAHGWLQTVLAEFDVGAVTSPVEGLETDGVMPMDLLSAAAVEAGRAGGLVSGGWGRGHEAACMHARNQAQVCMHACV